jgi:hypothetical protein
LNQFSALGAGLGTVQTRGIIAGARLSCIFFNATDVSASGGSSCFSCRVKDILFHSNSQAGYSNKATIL